MQQFYRVNDDFTAGGSVGSRMDLSQYKDKLWGFPLQTEEANGDSQELDVHGARVSPLRQPSGAGMCLQRHALPSCGLSDITISVKMEWWVVG